MTKEFKLLAYGTKLAIDGVKAAIEDEQAQLRLANALRQATGATDAQIKATEDMILKTSLATGIADDINSGVAGHLDGFHHIALHVGLLVKQHRVSLGLVGKA